MDNLSQLSDQELVARYTDGCNEAFDVLLSRHKDTVYGYISYNLNDQPQNIDDAFQETFVKAIVCLKEGRYTDTGRFAAWLTRIAHNVIVDLYREDSQLPTITCSNDERNVFDALNIADASHEEHLVNQQTLADVRLLMDKLPTEQREVVFMRYYEDLSFKEIANIIGASINTCLGRARYGIMNMRRMAQQHNISLELI